MESEPRDVERLGLWDAFLGDGKTLSREQGLHWSCLKLQVSIKDVFPSVSKQKLTTDRKMSIWFREF